MLDGTLDQIQAAYGADTVRVRVDGGADVLRALPGVTSVNDYGQLQEVRCGDPQALLAALVARARVQHFEITRPSLHDIFVRIARPNRRPSSPRRRRMRKVITIATSEFLTAVRAKGFLIGILFMPVLFGGALALQASGRTPGRQHRASIAIIDDTGGCFAPLSAAAAAWNRGERDLGPDVTGRAAVRGRSAWRPAPADGHEAVRLDCRNACAERGAVCLCRVARQAAGPETTEKIRYYSSAPAYGELPDWLHRSVMKEVVCTAFRRRQRQPPRRGQPDQAAGDRGARPADARRDGSVRAAQTVDKVRTIGVPVAFMFVLFIIVMTTTPQLLNSVLEEKMSRISEVLLGSVTPFQLMLGKLLASTSVSAVLTLVYLTGAAYAARRWGYLDVIDPRMLAWFVVFLLLAVLIYGSLFIAIGSACSDLKDAQNLMTPAMMLS